MKFKKGQKVRVNKNLKNIKDFVNGYMEKMAELEGKTVTIRSIDDGNNITIEEDENNYWWDERAFSLLKITKQELIEMSVGTIIYTDAKKERYQKWIRTPENNFTNGYSSYIYDDDIKEDLIFDEDEIDKDYGTKIIKIEEPTYETIYDSSMNKELKEVTLEEVEEKLKELGYIIKSFKEGE